MRATDVLANTYEDVDPTYPSFGSSIGRSKLEFPTDLKDVKVGSLKSRLDVEMSFMKVIFSDVFLHTLYGAGLTDCHLVRYDYKKEKLICRSRLSKHRNSPGLKFSHTSCGCDQGRPHRVDMGVLPRKGKENFPVLP